MVQIPKICCKLKYNSWLKYPNYLSHIKQVMCISALHVLTQCLMICDSINRNVTIFRDNNHHVTETNSNLDLTGHKTWNLIRIFLYFLCITKKLSAYNTTQINLMFFLSSEYYIYCCDRIQRLCIFSKCHYIPQIIIRHYIVRKTFPGSFGELKLYKAKVPQPLHLEISFTI